MDVTTISVFEKDRDFLERIRERYKLVSKAAALELINNKIKYLKVEGELR